MYEEVLDLDRLGDRQRWPNFASYVAQKYRGFHIDVVVAESSTALEFAVERFDEIFPGVPIVYGNAFEPVIDFSALPANVTGRRIPLPFAETFALARRLQPDAKRVYLVTGAAEMDSTVTSQAIHDLTPLLGGMTRLPLLRPRRRAPPRDRDPQRNRRAPGQRAERPNPGQLRRLRNPQAVRRRRPSKRGQAVILTFDAPAPQIKVRA